MNSYFATAEQQASPGLRGKPVGIVKAEGRSCVIAASVEAKKFGVKTGVSVWEAQALCPSVILVPADMDKYFSLTKRLVNIASDYSPEVEIFSIDEMFLDVTESQKCFSGGVLEIALEIKARIKKDLGEWMRASVGISHTKLLAKLASGMEKPDGLVWLSPDDYLERTERVAVSEVCGIGPARTKWLEARGAYTLGQARRLDLPPEIADLVWLKLDQPLITVFDLKPAGSVSRTYTTREKLDDTGRVLRLVRNLIEEAAGKLREMGMAGRTMALSLSGETEFWARLTIKHPTADPKIVYNLLRVEYEKKAVVGVRRAGVQISNLEFWKQESIFYYKRERMLEAVDRVNEKWGLFTLYPASLLGGELIRPEVTGYLGDKYHRLRRA